MVGLSMSKQVSRFAGKQRLAGQLAGGLLMTALALACTNALAQAAPGPDPQAPPSSTTTAEQHKAAADAVAKEAEVAEVPEAAAKKYPVRDVPEVQDVVEEVESEGPSSQEQGSVSMNDSFGELTRREKIIQQRKKAFEDTKADVQIRSMLLDRDKFDDSESSAMALGGYAGFKTGWFRDRFAFGATLYTSQKLYGPEDKDGTSLLKSGQEGYTVVGEAYGQYRFTDTVFFDLGRKALNTPYINKNDVRMTPNTFETAMLQGVLGDAKEGGQWRFGAGYVKEIKLKNADEFISMSEAAGAPDGVIRGVYAGGANYQYGNFSLGAVNYYSDDIINIFYTEAKYDLPISDTLKLRFGAQYTDQQSTGNDLLTGSDFSTDQFGLKAELGVGKAWLFTTAWDTNGDGADLRSPWGGIPSYNSVQVQDFNRAGEDSFMLRAGYDFQSVQGLSMYGLWVNGSQPDNPDLSAQDEYDFNIQWAAKEGSWKGFSARLRYAVVTQDDGGPDLQDFRIILNYDPPNL